MTWSRVKMEPDMSVRMTDEERELHEIADDGSRAYAPFTMADIQAALEQMQEVTPSPRHPVTPLNNLKDSQYDIN